MIANQIAVELHGKIKDLIRDRHQGKKHRLTFVAIEKEDAESIAELSKLATGIVKEHFDSIIGPEQNDYMIQKFQSIPAITEQILKGYEYFFVARKGENIGFIAFYKRGEDLYLSKFYLHKDFRGNGYSKEMLDFVIGKAKEHQVNRIVLNVNKDNSAVQVYEKLGFEKIGQERNDIGHGYYMDDYVFEYEII